MDKIYRFLVTGVTGTMGKILIKNLLHQFPNSKIVGLSRDEQKQRALPKDPRLRLKLCDIRDKASLYRSAVVGGWREYDVCFHLAALKCVDTLEDNPHDAFMTNVLGTSNVVDLCNELKTKIVFTSTDKAVYPINVYGNSKAIAEKLVLSNNKKNVVCRYGNVIGSRGSFIPALIDSLKNDKKAYITDMNMSRFWLTIEKAAKFLISCGMDDLEGLQVLKGMKSSKIINLVDCVAKKMKITDYHLEEIGIRKGEKISECIMNKYESPNGIDIMSSNEECLMADHDLSGLIYEMHHNEFRGL